MINPANPLNLNLFSTVSNPSACMPADIHISVTFYDYDDTVICSGTIESVTTQPSNVMSTNLEIRPLSALEFVRVINPRRPPAKRLFCNNLEGTGEVASNQIAAAASLRIRATILPRHGGVATTEAKMTLNGR